jgi:non-ribosomal peptide synthetase component F
LAPLTRREALTQFMTLLAGYVALLSRYTGQDDVVVGAPTTGRLRPEHGGLIGFFINNLPLRARLDGDPTFREVLARVRSTTLEAHEHQEVPFERLVEELQPERTLSHAPIFQVAFDVHSALETRLELSGVGVSVRPRDEVRAPFDLNVTAADRPDGLLLVAEYNTALFDGATVERFLARLERLLSEVADHPERRLSELEWLAEDEREQVLTAWNRTALPPPRAATLPELVSRQAALTPHATAVRDEAGNAFTYAELEARSNQVARWLRRQGVGPEVRVGILLERGAEVLAVLLGILKAGGVYIPLDAAYPADRLDYMLHDSGATLLLAHSSLAYALPEGSSPIFLDHELEAVERESADPIPDLPEGENAAYIIYTSGSTGRPKGVVVQHRGLVHFLTAMADRLGVEPDDVFAAVSTVAFDIAALDLYLPLHWRASSVGGVGGGRASSGRMRETERGGVEYARAWSCSERARPFVFRIFWSHRGRRRAIRRGWRRVPGTPRRLRSARDPGRAGAPQTSRRRRPDRNGSLRRACRPWIIVRGFPVAPCRAPGRV